MGLNEKAGRLSFGQGLDRGQDEKHSKMLRDFTGFGAAKEGACGHSRGIPSASAGFVLRT
jgi:hypothetical protein